MYFFIANELCSTFFFSTFLVITFFLILREMETKTKDENELYSNLEEEEEEDCTTQNPDVIKKYKLASAFVQKALAAVLDRLHVDSRISELCALGDQILRDETAKVYTKTSTSRQNKKIEKGIAFPTCISVNDMVCHYSPSEEDEKKSRPLSAGDVVRVDLACQIDGYCAVIANTAVVDAPARLKGRLADATIAAHNALDIAIRALRPGTNVYDITDLVQKVATDYEVNPVDGVLSHRMSRYIIDGSHVITNKASIEGKVRDAKIETNDVWALEVVFSTGSGKLKHRDQSTFVYKRSLECNYPLRLQISRDIFNEINRRFQTFPFAVRQLEHKQARIGLRECLKHDLASPYPVLYEKEGEVVVQVKATVLVLKDHIEVITKPRLKTSMFETSKCLINPKALAWKGCSLWFDRNIKKSDPGELSNQ